MSSVFKFGAVAALLALAVSWARADILIGQTAGFTGTVAASVKETTEGARLYLDAVNARGGVAGQALKLPKAPVVLKAVGPAGPNLLLVMVSTNERDFSALKPRSEGPYRILPSGDAALRIAANVLDSGKELKTIYVSQADPDYYFGVETIKEIFQVFMVN